MKIRMAIADDHPVILAGLRNLVEQYDFLQIEGVACNSSELIQVVSKRIPDIVVTDFSMPGGRYGDGMALLLFIVRRFPGVRVVVLTGVENGPTLRNMRSSGFNCLVGKIDPYENVIDAIKAAHLGLEYLSPSVAKILTEDESEVEVGMVAISKREAEVLRMYAEGIGLTEIAARLGRSRKTISTQKRSAMRKLGLGSNADIMRYAVQSGMILSPDGVRGDGGLS